MERLTFHNPDGSFGVVGMNEENQNDKLYACVLKLKDYEDTGLSPDDIEKLLSSDTSNVIRCKDCTAFLEDDTNPNNSFCVAKSCPENVFPDDFCSWGEKG